MNFKYIFEHIYDIIQTGVLIYITFILANKEKNNKNLKACLSFILDKLEKDIYEIPSRKEKTRILSLIRSIKNNLGLLLDEIKKLKTGKKEPISHELNRINNYIDHISNIFDSNNYANYDNRSNLIDNEIKNISFSMNIIKLHLIKI